jgi:hypothetical protein
LAITIEKYNGISLQHKTCALEDGQLGGTCIVSYIKEKAEHQPKFRIDGKGEKEVRLYTMQKMLKYGIRGWAYVAR